MAKMKEGLGEVFDRAPLSTRTFQQFPSIYGGEDPSALQYVNRAVSQLPLDALDIFGRIGEAGMLGAGAGASKIYQALGGSETMGERLGRDIYGLGQAVAPLIGVSPSPLSGARYPSASRAATSDPAPSGIATVAQKKPEIKGPTDRYLQLQAEQNKRSSDTGRSFVKEEMEDEALLDILEDVRGDIDESIDTARNMTFYEDYLDGPYGVQNREVDFPEDLLTDSDKVIDFLQDDILYRRDQGESIGDAIVNSLDKNLPDFEDGGLFMSADEIIDILSTRADGVYDLGLKKAKKRKRDAEANRAALELELNRAKVRNRQIERDAAQAEFEKSLGITDEMSSAQRNAIMDEYIAAEERAIAGIGIPKAETPKPNLRVVIDNTEDME